MTAPALSVAESSAAAAELETTADDFLSARLADHLGESPEDRDLPELLWPQLAGLGWFDVVAPERTDGLGLSPALLGGVVRAAGRALLPGPLLEHILVAPMLSRAADDSTARELLTPVLAGATFFAFADPVAGGGRGAAPRADTDGRVHGRVSLVPHAARAELLAVVVDNGNVEGGLERVVLVRAADPGVQIERRAPLTDTHEVADVVLDGATAVTLSDDATLLADLRSWLRLLQGAWSTGVAERALQLTVAYSGQREQFGRTIGSFQAVQHLVADMTAQVATMANLVSLALGRADATGPDDDDALAVKAHTSQTCLTVCESALQVHAGVGFTTAYPLHHYYKSALALRGHYGEPEDLYLELGRRALQGG